MRLSVFFIGATAIAAPSLPTLPVWFEPSGQSRFVSRGASGVLRLAPDSAVFSLPGGGSSVRLGLAGGRRVAAAEGLDRLGGTTQVFVGNDRNAWQAGIAHYGRVRYAEVYPGVDVVYYAQGKELEYDFVVKPGADPRLIRLTLNGTKPARLAEDGALLVEVDGRTVRQAAPSIYQEKDGQRTVVAGRYVLQGNQQVRFELGAYDRTKTLVIDPVLSFTSYLSWDRQDTILAVAAAPDGSIWVTGTTYSGRPIPDGQPAPALDGNQGLNDAYVARILPGVLGTPGALTYYAFVGGADADQGEGIALDSSGAVIVTGWTLSANFPIAGNAAQSTFNSNEDAFVTRIDPSVDGTSSLTFSTYFGGTAGATGSNIDMALALAVRPNGNVVVTGTTTSGTLPTGLIAGMQNSNQGGYDLFVAEFNPGAGSAADALVYATFVGGDSSDSGAAVALDSSGRVFITGFTSSSNFPVNGPAVYISPLGFGDAYLLVLDTTKAGLDGFLYGSYFGGSELDGGTAIAVDSSGKVWLSGYTMSNDYPTTPGAYRTARAGEADAFVARLDVTLPRQDGILNSTYLGGGSADVAMALVLDGGLKVVLGGYTYSADFPKIGTVLPPGAPPFGADMFLAEFDFAQTGLASLVSSGTINGSGLDTITGLARDPNGNLLFGGTSNSSNLPVLNGEAKLSTTAIPAGFVGRITPSAQ